MVKAQIYYFNDEHETVRIRNQGGDDAITKLKPANGAYFTIEMPDNAVPFIKKWEDFVLIGWIVAKG